MSHKPYADPIQAVLRQRREALSWTQTELAQRLGLSGPDSIGDWERGRCAPTLASLRRWTEALDCDVFIIARSEPPVVTDEDAGLPPPIRVVVERLTRQGMSSRHIAERLRISQRSVVRHRAELGVSRPVKSSQGWDTVAS